MGRVRRNNYYVPRSDAAAHSILHYATLRARPVQHFDYVAVGRRFARIFNSAAGDQRGIALDYVVDLRDLTVLDSAAPARAVSLRTMNHADANIVFAIDAHDANCLVTHRRRGGFLHGRLDLHTADVSGRTTRRVGRLRPSRGGDPCEPHRSFQHPPPPLVFTRVYIRKWRKAKGLNLPCLPNDRFAP